MTVSTDTLILRNMDIVQTMRNVRYSETRMHVPSYVTVVNEAAKTLGSNKGAASSAQKQGCIGSAPTSCGASFAAY